MFDSLKNSFSKFTRSVEAEVDGDGDGDADPASEVEAEGVAEPDATDAESGDDGVGLTAKAKSLARGKRVITEETLAAPLGDLELALLSGSVEANVVDAILDGVRADLVGETRRIGGGVSGVINEAVASSLHEVLAANQFDLVEYVERSETPVTLVFTGINGVGKTTTIAKLSRYFEARGLSTVMANGDTYRAGAEEQIADHAAALDTKLIAHEQGGDPAAVIYDAVEYAEANDVDVVLGDTAGRLHTSESLMAQLEKIDRVVGPDLTIYVDEAVAGQDAVNRVDGFDEAAAIDGVILTKADADSSGGAAISMAHVTGCPVLYLGVGQAYDDLVRFDPDGFIDEMLADA